MCHEAWFLWLQGRVYRLNDITMACYDMVWLFGNIMAHGNANFFYWIKIDRLCVLEYAYEIQTP